MLRAGIAPVGDASPTPAHADKEDAIDETNLLVTLVIALGAAGVGALLAASFRQPVVLGFILAGLAIGPDTPCVEDDSPAAEELAHLGVLLLLFDIGAPLAFVDVIKVVPGRLVNVVL